jgi:hypothetical protein
MKRPGIFDRIESMAVDFNSEEASDPQNDPFAFMHEKEKDVRAMEEVRHSESCLM